MAAIASQALAAKANVAGAKLNFKKNAAPKQNFMKDSFRRIKEH